MDTLKGQGVKGLNKGPGETPYGTGHHLPEKRGATCLSSGVQTVNADIQTEILLLVTRQGTTGTSLAVAGPQGAAGAIPWPARLRLNSGWRRSS